MPKNILLHYFLNYQIYKKKVILRLTTYRS